MLPNNGEISSLLHGKISLRNTEKCYRKAEIFSGFLSPLFTSFLALYKSKIKAMIKSFKSKALKLFWEDGDPSKLPAERIKRIKRMLQSIEHARVIPDDLKREISFEIHALKGSLKGYWSLVVNGNYRIIFAFVDGHAYDLDYLDYH
ncbi:type II toxin-antitoxin system RelE/ParE family toxin [Chitinophaga sp. YIM B06452]|uniref:type II toxin-antitoxin system RelE/ParE family toxin n=1 Tax=Chitinophaga sp. YIM B06452 TaxID=3082158 RepID=UPI0031FEEC7C